MMDEKGQIAVDFLLGISLFLIALTFTVQFIPGMFMSGTAGESSLDYTAYRTATVLVEDTGWWGNSTSSGTDWETQPSNMMRIGLAADDEPKSKLTNSPNLLSKAKIEQFMLVNENTLIENLGLYNNVDNTHFSYGYNISINQEGVPLVLNSTAIMRGKPTPLDREVSKITRVVLVETGTVAVLKGSELTGEIASEAIINVTGPFEENITIQIRNLNGANHSFLNAVVDNVTLTPSSDYTIYKKTGWTDLPLNGSLTSTDLICLNLDHNRFNLSQDYKLELRFSNVTLDPGPPFIRYNNHSSPLYEPAYLTVEVWQ
ncbi:DUF7287 family protein [Methanolobus psychrotolerans]|uniref:DUF7287 family protein n=1 Tax=Methanolobus psychrotolerans TaxID=1874706 RepID=UPI000B91956A|nr:hypothetical protein [Methanolobus psychrotolerans]